MDWGTGGGLERWLDEATRGIRFGPDRRMVAEELAAHLEDKTSDLQRIFPDMTEAEARERAISRWEMSRSWEKNWQRSTSPGWGGCGRSPVCSFGSQVSCSRLGYWYFAG